MHIKEFESEQKPYESVTFECPRCCYNNSVSNIFEGEIPYGESEQTCPNCGCKFILTIPKE